MPSKKKPAKPAAKPAPKPEAKPATKPEPTAKLPAKKPVAKPRAAAPTPAATAPAKPAPAKPLAKKPAAAKPAPKQPAPPPAPKRSSKPPPASLDDLDGPDDDDLEATAAESAEAEEREPAAEDDDGDAAAPRRPSAVAEDEEAEAPPKVKRAPKALPPLPPRKPGVITVGVSGDADDAFMIYALQHGKVDTAGRVYEFLQTDIAVLNEAAKKGTYDVTAFSFGAWPDVSTCYTVLPCGGSFGDHVGPVLVSKTPVRSSEVDGLTVAVPGLSTTATLVLRLWLSRARMKLVPVPFDKIGAAVKSGMVRAGLLIHEGQLTYKAEGLARVVDLGQWWGELTEGLPLPLGGNAVRRDIPAQERAGIALDMKRSIAYAMGHRDEALAYAAKFSRGLAKPLLDKYVSMYVNELTLDFGERGKQAVQDLYDRALRAGLLKERLELDFI
jgi:1,4-dihydroxy-6-naphthoate synthase